MSDRELKLKAELVPKTSWYKNMRSELPSRVWNKIRKDVCAYQGHKCGICKDEGKLSCHELWEYDDLNHIQKLKGFIALCDLCHHVKHLGHASKLASEGKLEMSRVEEHFMRVNECDSQAFKRHVLRSMAQYKERSENQWRVDLGKYKWQVKPRS